MHIALKDLIEGKYAPYGLFHATRTPLEEIERVGLRYHQIAPDALQKLVHHLTQALGIQPAESLGPIGYVNQFNFPPEMRMAKDEPAGVSLNNQDVLLTVDQRDTVFSRDSVSEAERRAENLLSFAMATAPDVMTGLRDVAAKEGFTAALDLLESRPTGSFTLLQLIDVPGNGTFSLLAHPDQPVTKLELTYSRGEPPRPVARIIRFNGVVPISCLKVVPVQIAKRANRVV